MRIKDLTTVHAEQGHCWIWPLAAEVPDGDCANSPPRSNLILFEDGRMLGPAHGSHADIRAIGRGRFSHWERTLFFSSSDNSDPRKNRRRYQALWLEEADLADRLERTISGTDSSRNPVNYSVPDSSTVAIDRDARYALTVARTYTQLIETHGGSLRGKRVVEFGPGHNLGTPLILKCLGAAQVAAADRFLPPYRREYHDKVYQRIASLLDDDPSADIAPLKQCVDVGSHSPIVELIPKPLEQLSAEGLRPFDITLSNAVFEHLFDPATAINNLASLTAPGGFGFHQVDFRDHRHFDRPLEYLLLDEFSFSRLFHESHGETGNRVRPDQMEAMFRAAQFRSIEFHENLAATDEYLNDLAPRLAASRVSPYCMLDRTSLHAIGGRFIVKR